MSNSKVSDRMIALHEVSKSFPDRGEVIHNISAVIPHGIVGLLGPNGAGKTTLMRLLCGIYMPSSGYLTYGDDRIDDKKGSARFKSVLGYLPQNIGFSKHLTVIESLRYMCHIKNRNDLGKSESYLESLLEEVSLLDSRNQRAGSLSGGMTRRLGIAQALIGDPSVLVVDEPTAGLDPEERLRFRRLLARFAANRTVLLSTHILDDVSSTCDHVMFMQSGTIIDSGILSDVVRKATGHVWITPPLSSSRALGSEYEIVAEEPGIDGTRYRVVGNNPAPGFVDATPTLDDVYLLKMKGEIS
ncbi:ATP-binding cassette domain-containing protein [Corynebacterium sp. CCM 9204]|uniref:ATP-binding cassette domain-containing protein n=1 Tax=Corynebacterium sp. CCM 9204 TaxID=3057616 RepID=UPI00352331F1